MSTHPQRSQQHQSARLALTLLGVLGLIATPVAWWALQPYQVNLIRYQLEPAASPKAASTLGFSIVAFAFPIALAVLAARRSGLSEFFRSVSPMVACAPLACGVFSDQPPHFAWLLLTVSGAALSAYLSGTGIDWKSIARPRIAITALLVLVGILTFLHVKIQINFHNHFMLGHADIGHFTEELKNALAGRGLRSDSFDNTRLGWHFVPLMYVLVPGYWLWPSITYLMTLGPLVLHLAAMPFYWVARRCTGSVLIAFLAALAWLLVPSLSRLVYSNTYGFAWLYTSVPILAFLLGAMLLGRWKLFWFLVVVLLLSRETHAAITFGIGAYLAAFTPKRRSGLVLIAFSVAYGILCATVIIPHFAAAGRYERLDIFGELGGSLSQLVLSPFTNPGLFFERLFRAQSIWFLLLLLASLCFLPIRGWRLALAALPALAVHLLMENPEWISIKFWHHAMVLPILFFAALCVLRNRAATVRERADQDVSHAAPFFPAAEGLCEGRVPPLPPEIRGEGNPHHQRNLGLVLALLTAAAISHYLFGFSPLSKSYDLYAADPFLQSPDPRLAFVEQLRREIPRDRTILATERVAAHFTDYRELYTGRRIRPADFVILDQSDRWDTSGLPARAAEFAANPHYSLHAQSGPIVVFNRTHRSDGRD